MKGSVLSLNVKFFGGGSAGERFRKTKEVLQADCHTCLGRFIADGFRTAACIPAWPTHQILFAGTHKWTANHCGYVSVVAVGGGSGGGWQWSSGGGGGGGLGYIKKYPVVKGKQYTVVVGKSGTCQANAGNTHASDGGTSYFVSSGTVAGYGGKLPLNLHT